MAIDNEKIQNVYAKDIKGEDIHISEAPSGAKGYYCQGCGQEMQSVRHKTDTIRDFFRHFAKDVNHQRQCTYSDETYRHKLGKEILQRLKEIKVPRVYKYPPSNSDGGPLLLEKSKTIKANHVTIETFFFENSEGHIRWSKSLPADSFLLVKPDVCFLNESNEPILFIELVATHKVDDDKRIKLRRLGIDTVQVRIPKGSPQEIEEVFKRTQSTKWIYNNVEATTDYKFLPVPEGNSEKIPRIDEEQRKLFKESFKCRSAEIGNLIRSINKCLESESYRTIDRRLRQELQRVKENTKTARHQLESKEREIKSSIQEEFANDERFIIQRHRKLEERYLAKNKELGEEEEELRRAEEFLAGRYTEEERRISDGGQSFEERREFIANETRRVQEEIESIIREMESIPSKEREAGERISNEGRNRIRDIQQGTRNLQSKIIELPERFKKLEAEERIRFEAEEREIEKEQEGALRVHEQRKRELRINFEERRKRLIEQAERRDFSGNDDFSRRLMQLDKDRSEAECFENEIEYNNRIREAHECFKKGAWKNW